MLNSLELTALGEGLALLDEAATFFLNTPALAPYGIAVHAIITLGKQLVAAHQAPA